MNQQEQQLMANNGTQIHNAPSDPSDPSEIDLVEKKKEEQKRRNEWLKEKMEVRRKQQIQFIMTQTNYGEIQATQKLEEFNNDTMKVVGEYLGISPKKDENANKTKNQKVFSVIRDIMDSGSRNFIVQQERAKKIEEVKKAMEKRNQQNESLKNEQNVKIIKDKID